MHKAGQIVTQIRETKPKEKENQGQIEWHAWPAETWTGIERAKPAAMLSQFLLGADSLRIFGAEDNAKKRPESMLELGRE
jgi:hypothetical protein